MIVLRAVDASFAREEVLVEPFTFVLRSGERIDVPQPNVRAASIAARMCAAIVKPSAGTIFVGDYETRLQAPEAKRRVGFVDAGGFDGDDHAFRCEVAFRADVWGLGARQAQTRAREVLAALGEGRYARAIALALVADVFVVVLDQPGDRVVERVRELVPAAGIAQTRVAVARRLDDAPLLAPAAT
jgi:ABC-type Na+ transport system ATPase subunit NatA